MSRHNALLAFQPDGDPSWTDHRMWVPCLMMNDAMAEYEAKLIILMNSGQVALVSKLRTVKEVKRGTLNSQPYLLRFALKRSSVLSWLYKVQCPIDRKNKRGY